VSLTFLPALTSLVLSWSDRKRQPSKQPSEPDVPREITSRAAE